MRRLAFPLLISLLVVSGVTLVLYPSAANWVSQANQSAITGNYHQTVGQAQPPARQQLAAAHAYNRALASGAELNPNTRIPVGAGEFDASSPTQELTYDQILRADSTGLMARLRIDVIDVDLPIYHGTSDATLLKGVGHLFKTSLPVGGEGTRTVLTAHRGLASARLFTDLNLLRIGDTFTIEVFGEMLLYRVIDTVVVEPEDRETVRAIPGRDLATLITCTPLGINSHRIVVTGERVIPLPEKTAEQQAAAPNVPRFPWWAVAWLTTVFLALIYLGYAAYAPRLRHSPGGYTSRHRRRSGSLAVASSQPDPDSQVDSTESTEEEG